MRRTVPSNASRWIPEAAAAFEPREAALNVGDRAPAAERPGRASFLHGEITKALDPTLAEKVRGFSI